MAKGYRIPSLRSNLHLGRKTTEELFTDHGSRPVPSQAHVSSVPAHHVADSLFLAHLIFANAWADEWGEGLAEVPEDGGLILAPPNQHRLHRRQAHR